MKFLKYIIPATMCLATSMVHAECYIMGDSIAQGVAINRKDCSSETQVGINTNKAMKYWLNKGLIVKDKVIISLGVNDGNIDTKDNLMLIRNNIKANQVIWILPPKQDKSILVRKIANNYGDFVLNINSQLGKDKIHPTGKGYVKIAEHIKVFQIQDSNEQVNDLKVKSTSKYQYDRNFIQN